MLEPPPPKLLLLIFPTLLPLHFPEIELSKDLPDVEPISQENLLTIIRMNRETTYYTLGVG